MPLDKNADAGDFIKDFRKSKAPQFKGKSKKQRDKMAVAAYLDSRKEKQEKVGMPEPNKELEMTPAEKRKRIHGVNEEMMFKVSVDGLPDMIMLGRSPGDVKNQLRKIVKQPSMITDVERMSKADVKKRYRDMAKGSNDEEV